MQPLALHEFHQSRGGRFVELNGREVVAHHGDPLTEQAALRQTAGVLDLSFRGRLCLTGTDRVRFLHGQVTNDVQKLRVGEGCYTALVTARGRMVSDLNIYRLDDELLLDFEPGLTQTVSQRLEKYIVADDVQVADVAPHYGLLSIQGPRAAEVVRSSGRFDEVPNQAFRWVKVSAPTHGEVYLMNQPRLGTRGFDLFVPTATLASVAERLITSAKSVGGRSCGWEAFDIARIEAGIPRFGVDMDETNIPLECGIEERAVSYNKGCYIGQEVINRIHTIGQVTKTLRGLRLGDDLKALPTKGTTLFKDGKEVGYITSALASPTLKANVALGYARKEVNQIGAELTLRNADGESPVTIVPLPFGPS